MGDRVFAIRDANGKFGSGKTTRRFRLLRDAGPVHVLTTSSLEWVATEYGPTGGDARRYRPNIVLDTGRDPRCIEEEWLGARSPAPPAFSASSSNGTRQCAASTRRSPHQARSG
jgi:hypothetical protein